MYFCFHQRNYILFTMRVCFLSVFMAFGWSGEQKESKRAPQGAQAATSNQSSLSQTYDEQRQQILDSIEENELICQALQDSDVQQNTTSIDPMINSCT